MMEEDCCGRDRGGRRSVVYLRWKQGRGRGSCGGRVCRGGLEILSGRGGCGLCGHLWEKVVSRWYALGCVGDGCYLCDRLLALLLVLDHGCLFLLCRHGGSLSRHLLGRLLCRVCSRARGRCGLYLRCSWLLDYHGKPLLWFMRPLKST